MQSRAIKLKDLRGLAADLAERGLTVSLSGPDGLIIRLGAVRSSVVQRLLSGSLIAGNWLTYVWSVNSGRMLEASLGYYINPLVNVLLGMLILGERLRRLQWAAVALAAVGVAQQVWQVGSLPWVSLVLALTFGFYGLIRKQAPVKALPGLVVETWMLVPIAVAWLLFNQIGSADV